MAQQKMIFTAKDLAKDPRQFEKTVLTFTDVTGVVGAGQSTGKIGLQNALHRIDFLCMTAAGVGLTRSEMIADIVDVTVKANGKTLRKLTTTQILDMYKHYHDDKGAFTPEGVLPIYFVEQGFDFASLNNATAMGMYFEGRQITLTYEITYAAVLTALSRIQVKAMIDGRDNMAFGSHRRIKSYTRTFTGTEDHELTDLPQFNSLSRLMAYHIELGTGVVDMISVKHGTRDVYENMTREQIELWLNDIGRKPQAGYFHVPFDWDNDPRGGIYTYDASTWLFMPYWSTTPGGQYKIIEERVHATLD